MRAEPAEPNDAPLRYRHLRNLSISRVLRWGGILFGLIWLYSNCHNDLPLRDLVDRYTFPDSRFVEVNGMTVHYRMKGSGEPIVLLHDANNSLHTWNAWVDALSERYQVIAIDLPGFGLTGPHPRGSYSTFMYTSFLQEFVQKIGLKRFHLAGNGLGAQIAWFYATEYPGKLRRLILLDAPGFEVSRSSLVGFLAKTPVLNRLLWTITPRSTIRLMLENMYADDSKIDRAMIDRHFELLLRRGNRKAFTDRCQVSENRPPADLVGKIAVPTLILWGAEDTRLSPEFAYEFHRRIRSSYLRIYQNTGHWPQEESPAQSLKDVKNFLVGRF